MPPIHTEPAVEWASRNSGSAAKRDKDGDNEGGIKTVVVSEYAKPPDHSEFDAQRLQAADKNADGDAQDRGDPRVMAPAHQLLKA